MKKLAALVLSAALLAGSAAAVPPEEAFPAVNTYPGYTDVQAGSWYAAPVQVCYEDVYKRQTWISPWGSVTGR